MLRPYAERDTMVLTVSDLESSTDLKNAVGVGETLGELRPDGVRGVADRGPRGRLGWGWRGGGGGHAACKREEMMGGVSS